MLPARDVPAMRVYANEPASAKSGVHAFFVRLFQPPEPVEAQWVLPDDPPFRFTWRRRQHRVMHADGPERIAEEWWIEGGPVNARPVNARIGAADAIRDYYRVEDIEGRRFWLFRAGLPGDPPPRWFLHGIFA